MALGYFRHSQTGEIVSGDPDNPTFRQTLVNMRRSDPARAIRVRGRAGLFPFDPDGLAGREAIVARVLAATGQAVTDFLGTGEPTNDRVTALLDQTAAVEAPRTSPGNRRCLTARS